MNVTIADILHHAADKYLASSLDEWKYMDKDKFSCCAIEHAVEDLLGWKILYEPFYDQLTDGLRAMGLDISSLQAFYKWEKDDPFYDVQQARYGWLKLAALMAEEQRV